MEIRGSRLAGSILVGLLALAACAGAFAQGPPPGGGHPGGRPGPGGPGFPPPGGDRPGEGPRRRGEGPPPPEGRRAPRFGPSADMVSAEMRFGDRQVKGVPYSAQFVSESTRTLANGVRISRNSTGAVYRDGEGRTRREMTLGAVGPVMVEEAPVPMVFINDWVARVHYALNESDHTARKVPLRDAPEGAPEPAREGEGDAPKTESLGKRTIEGVEAEGTRTTITIPAGRVGNDRAIEIVSERWYSPELQVVVLSSHKDPFVGDTVYRLTGISRGEPDATRFHVPADYTVVEGPPPQNPPRKPRQ
ncbi:MAG TPA: hypothetical protein VNZ44_01460 [Pyrinomonadaceae bacterium]|nr:hypothetical protein [Pyrinomonadaceae bacterium]